MKLEQSFEVAAPIDRVWSTLIDIERVAPCLPGAAVTGRNEDGSYTGTFKVKIGPTSASYTGKLHMDDLQADDHTATMHASGTDKRGQGGAKATIKSKLTAVGETSTRVEVDTDYHITGRLARFGRGGMIEDISERLLRDFATCLQTSLAGTPDLSQQAAGWSDGAASAGAGVSAESGAAAAVAESGEIAAVEVPGGSGEVAAVEVSAGSGEAAAAGTALTPGEAAAAQAAAASPAAAAAVGAGGGTGPAGSAVPGPGAPASGEPDPGAAGAGLPVDGAPMPSAEPLDGLSLVGSVLWGRVKGSAAPVALLVGLLFALLAFRRARRR